MKETKSIMIKCEKGEKMEKIIDEFTGEFEWLGNYYGCEVIFEGLKYQSAEAAYQSAKNQVSYHEKVEWLGMFGVENQTLSDDLSSKLTDVLTMAKRLGYTKLSPEDAKKRGQECKLRADWEDVKEKVMREILMSKFKNNEELKMKLLNTGNAKLINGNHRGDTYWGMVNGKGKNILGEILTDVREDIEIDTEYEQLLD